MVNDWKKILWEITVAAHLRAAAINNSKHFFPKVTVNATALKKLKFYSDDAPSYVIRYCDNLSTI